MPADQHSGRFLSPLCLEKKRFLCGCVGHRSICMSFLPHGASRRLCLRRPFWMKTLIPTDIWEYILVSPWTHAIFCLFDFGPSSAAHRGSSWLCAQKSLMAGMVDHMDTRIWTTFDPGSATCKANALPLCYLSGPYSEVSYELLIDQLNSISLIHCCQTSQVHYVFFPLW